MFGSNSKAQTAAKAVFDLAHRHGNILREGWKNIMDSMLQLFRSELLPKAMVEVSVPQALFHGVSDQIIPAATVHVTSLRGAIFTWPSAFYGHCCPLLVTDATLCSSGGGLFRAKWENFPSTRGNPFKSVSEGQLSVCEGAGRPVIRDVPASSFLLLCLPAASRRC